MAVRIFLSAALLAVTTTLIAQAPLTPQGGLRIQTAPAVLGSSFPLRLDGTANAQWVGALDVVPGATSVGFGTVWLGFSPALQFVFDSTIPNVPPLPASGLLTLPIPLPLDPGLNGSILYFQAASADATGIALSNAKSLQLGLPDSYNPSLSAMTEPRAFHRLVPLPNGAYLAIGGGAGQFLTPIATTGCDRYDPYSRTWTADTPLGTARTLHTATVLQDGRVFVTGGSLTGGVGVNGTEIYDPALGTWTVGPNLTAPITAGACAGSTVGDRIGHAATLLNDGRVLITGGTNSFNIPTGSTNYLCIFAGSSASADIYDPLLNTITPLPSMNSARTAHAQVLLPDGRVLICGGLRGGGSIFGQAAPLYSQMADIFDPATNTFTAVPEMAASRITHTLTVLSGGQVMAIGGAGGSLVVTTDTTEIFDIASLQWLTGPTLPNISNGIALHTATALSDGSIYVAGGAFGALGSFTAIDLAWRYTPAVGFTQIANLPSARQAPTALETPEGVLLVGGAGSGVMGTTLDSSVMWTPPF